MVQDLFHLQFRFSLVGIITSWPGVDPYEM